ncbi:DUF4157 domain-containing protein [Chitinophaga sp. MM2321]|uniref:eCIS core domain-containing protein n=1 Tax=Chitinophaga sp. MM2321 TaxID=3137178 RepID=UPI0032D5A8E9
MFDTSKEHKSTAQRSAQDRDGANGIAIQAPIQQKPEEELQAKSAMQLKSMEEEQLPLQGKFVVQRAKNEGMPDQLQSGIAHLSGMDISNVNVHYNSAKPAQLNAYAYAQGNDIHLGPGQEKHLPHEAWHVVQQRQGRVQPTMQMKQGVPVNDDPGLEQEADNMGAQAMNVSNIKE